MHMCIYTYMHAHIHFPKNIKPGEFESNISSFVAQETWSFIVTTYQHSIHMKHLKFEEKSVVNFPGVRTYSSSGSYEQEF